METVSLINAPRPQRCPECSQPIFKISERVATVASELLESEPMANIFKDYYSLRSKAVHTGMPFSSQNYTGMSIPLLDPSQTNGCQSRSNPPSINLLEWVGFCLRKVLREQVHF